MYALLPDPYPLGCPPAILVTVLLALSASGGCIATVTEEGAPGGGGGAPPAQASHDTGAAVDSGSGIWLMPDAAADAGGPPPVVDSGGGACESACTGRECGPDGCGGVCGTCASGATCTDAGACELPPPAANCPPVGATGNSPGVIAENITLYSCDGTSVPSHSACGKPVYVYSHSESCGSCITYARSGANADAEEFDRRGAEYWFVVTIGRGYSPNAVDCERVRSEYGLTMPVFFVTDMWDFATAYGSTGAGPGALLDSDHRIVMLGSAKSSYERNVLFDAAAGL